MAVDLESIRWAVNDITKTETYTDVNGVDSQVIVANKVEPTAQLRNSGWLFEEPAARAHINFMFNKLYEAIQDLETRLTALE